MVSAVSRVLLPPRRPITEMMKISAKPALSIQLHIGQSVCGFDFGHTRRPGTFFSPSSLTGSMRVEGD